MKKHIVLFLFLSVALYSQKLSLLEAIDKAIKTYPQIKEFKLGVSQSNSKVKIANSDYFPQVNFNAEYNPTKTYVLPANGVFNTKESDGWVMGVSLEQKIWDFSKTRSNVNTQKESLKIAKLSLKDAKSYLAYKVKLQYELILVNQEAIEVRSKDLESKEAFYKQAQALVKEGMKTSADASRFLAACYEAEDNLAIAKANYDKSLNRLSLYIGETIGRDVILEKSRESKFSGVDEDSILKNVFSLQQLKHEIKKSYHIYKTVKAARYGSIDAIASYSRQDTLNEYNSQLIGVTFNMPIYSSGKISAQVQEAELNKQILQSQYNLKNLEIKEEIESLVIDIHRYEKTIESKKAQLNATTNTTNILQARYKEGLTTYLEVLDANALKLDAKLGLLNAKYERNSSIHRIEYLQGKI